MDESDENLSVKFELIYTMGSQRPIELSPDRWTCIQQVLDLVKTISVDIAESLPVSLERINRRDGSFPRIRILKLDAEERLLNEVAGQICKFGLDGFPIARQPKHVRDEILTYIMKFDLIDEEIDKVEMAGFGGILERQYQVKIALDPRASSRRRASFRVRPEAMARKLWACFDTKTSHQTGCSLQGQG